MTDAPGPHTTLHYYPWVVVRFACTRCRTYANVRLAMLVERCGATATLGELIARFQAVCPHRPRKRNGRIALRDVACGGYCPDLGSPRPPDLPPSLAAYTLIEGGKTDMLPAEMHRQRRRRRVGGEED